MFHFMRVIRVCAESRQRHYRRRSDCHRVGRCGIAFQKFLDLFLKLRVLFEVFLKHIQFFTSRQFVINQQIAHFQKTGLFRKLLNRVAPVAQDAFLTIDKRDRTGAGASVAVTGVEGDGAGLRPQFRKINRDFAFRTFENRKLKFLILQNQFG